MPKATVNTNAERYELKSCPEGWIEIKRMSYGQWLQRSQMAVKMQVQQQRKGGNQSMDIQMEALKLALFEYKNCVVDHNLEDDGGQKLNLNTPDGVQILDPQIGNEIGDIIEEIHAPVKDSGNSNSASEEVSS